MFLTQDEIETLTGYVKHKKQREWLSNNGYSFKVACSGRPYDAFFRPRTLRCNRFGLATGQ